MKLNPKNQALPAFWITGKITSVYNDGQNATLEIARVIGTRNQKAAQLLEGNTAVIDGRSIMPACVLEHKITKTGVTVVDPTDERLGHRYVEGLEIGAFVEFDMKALENCDPNLGIQVQGWTLLHCFEAAKRDADKANAIHFRDLEEKKARAERQKNMPFQIVQNGRVLTTQTLTKLAAFFEHRAWPKGVEWKTLVGGKWQVVEEPGMLPAPKHITTPRPEIRVQEMHELYETVKHLSQTVEQSSDDPEEVIERYRRKEGVQIGGIRGLDQIESKVIQMPAPASAETPVMVEASAVLKDNRENVNKKFTHLSKRKPKSAGKTRSKTGTNG